MVERVRSVRNNGKPAEGGLFCCDNSELELISSVMKVHFEKYQALGNDFLVVDSALSRIGPKRLHRLIVRICDRRLGIGADGVLYVGGSRSADAKADVYNSDGSWAEKSGNGLRIMGLHLARRHTTRKRFTIEMGGELHFATVKGRSGNRSVTTELGRPDFHAQTVPMKSRRQFHINSPIRVGGIDFPVTCLSVGNPHAVLFVDDFEFDWHTLGRDIEHHRVFPDRANVEFVKVINRGQVQVCDWERGAGATGSSGTGASAVVCAGVVLGVIDRKCTVDFPGGAIEVHWRESDECIEISGRVAFVASGDFEFR